MTSDGEGNGPVRRIARGGGRSAVLQGGCVEEDESKEPGDGHGAGMMAVEKTSATDDNDGFRQVFSDGYGFLCRAHPSLRTGVDWMPPVLASQTS
jgi:hypothetical protein